MKYVQSFIAVVGVTAASVACLPVAVLFGLTDASGRLGWVPTRAWAWAVLVSGGVERVFHKGFEKLEATPGAIVMSNHESLLDPVVMMALSKSPMRFLAKHRLFYLPLLGWAMWANGHLPVRRGSAGAALQSLRASGRLLARKSSIVIFPEGCRALCEELLPFRRGGFVLALQSGVPIIPIGIADTRKVCPKGWHWAVRSSVSAVVGDPIDTSTYDRMSCDALMEVVRDRILELRSEAAALAGARS